MAYPYKWFVGSKDGCSCAFRHLHTSAFKLGFGEPEDWYPEEIDDIDASKEFYSVVQKLVVSGQFVECLDIWSDDDGHGLSLDERVVDVSAINPDEFRFFENCRFRFVSGT